MKKLKFKIGDRVYDKLHDCIGTVINNYGNPTEGNRGEIRLDTDGNVPIFEYNEKLERIGHNLTKMDM